MQIVRAEAGEALFAGLDDKELLRSELRRLFRWLKDKGVTAVIIGERGDSSLTGSLRDGEAGISSLIDTWIILDSFEASGERKRSLSVLQSRGTPHSNQIREFVMSKRGLTIMSGSRANGHAPLSAGTHEWRDSATNGHGSVRSVGERPT